ncbi:MAG: DNA adenine methylase [Romboutsia sp.]|nr:DNA adenine methylase [Romboutsia sp.]
MAAYNFSPLRYPGGKNKLSKYVAKLIEYNNLINGTYVEPYAGGAAVALNLLLNGKVSNIIINDYDRSIYAFWHSVLNDTDNLCRLIENTPINLDIWNHFKDLQKNKEDVPLLELGFATFYLNRTNRSGIIKAGVIGGKNQNGNYKMDCRFPKSILIDKIRLIAEHRDNIQLYNLDTVDLIDDVINQMQENTFIFFDPPYYKKGSTLYVNYYKHQDHENLKNKITDIQNHKWIVTYDNVDEISNLYSNFRSIDYSLTYTAEKKYSGSEIMIFSDNMSLNEELLEVK